MFTSFNLISFLFVAVVFVGLFWPWNDEKKKKPTESKQVLTLKRYIKNLRLENEELKELLTSAENKK